MCLFLTDFGQEQPNKNIFQNFLKNFIKSVDIIFCIWYYERVPLMWNNNLIDLLYAIPSIHFSKYLWVSSLYV